MINKAELFRKVGGILTELNDQYEYISENPASLNELELELLSANADFLAEHIKILLKLSLTKQEEPAAEAGKLPVAEVTAPSDELSFPEKSDATVADDGDVFSAAELRAQSQVTSANTGEPAMPLIEEVPPVQIQTPVAPAASSWQQPPVEETPQVRQPEPLPAPVIPEVVVPVVPAEPAVRAESVDRGPAVVSEQPVVRTLNDIISGQKAPESVSGRLSHQPVKDLKSIVSLNDKLLFIKELFNGYSLAYSEAIEILNRFDSFEAAEAFLQSNYAAKNNWGSKEAAVEKFYEILHRRFG